MCNISKINPNTTSSTDLHLSPISFAERIKNFFKNKFTSTPRTFPDLIARLNKEALKPPSQGFLKIKKKYVYLKLDRRYVRDVIKIIRKHEHKVRAPYSVKNIGHHISVIRADEWKGRPAQISKLASSYIFKPVCYRVIQLKKKRLWLLIVKPDPRLVKLRKSLGMSAKPHNHDFHITIAEQFFRAPAR